ncbi:hypothetical protein KY284_001453 [Solanum tuberosum]|nr:hypothetical protein KY284_001453 [Solanum tuberosum]
MAPLKSVSIEREGLSELTDESGSIVVLPVYAESTRLFPKRIAGAKGSDIVLEALLEADVAKNAKEFFSQPQNKLKNNTLEDAVMSKITSVSHLVDESGESLTVDFSKIYMDEVDGVKKACIYGLGSQVVFYENVGSSSTSTSQPQDCSFDARVKEYVQEMKEEMKREMREELREEMKNEMQLEMQEQVDKILQERLPILIAGLPKPPPGTLPASTPPTGTPH